MKNNKKPNFFEWNKKILINSFKRIDSGIAWIVAMDAVFYFLSGYIFLQWFQRIQERMDAIKLPDNIFSQGYQRAQQMTSDVQSFYYLIVGSFIVLLLAIILLATIAKGIIWAKTAKTKVTMGFLSKFFALNLIWMGFWFAIVILISLAVQRESVFMFMVIVFAAGFYLTNNLYSLFMQKQEIGAIKKAVSLSISRIHLFVLPYAVLYAILYIVSKLSGLMKFSYSFLVVMLVLSAYDALQRYYASELVYSVEKLSKPKSL